MIPLSLYYIDIIARQQDIKLNMISEPPNRLIHRSTGLLKIVQMIRPPQSNAYQSKIQNIIRMFSLSDSKIPPNKTATLYINIYELANIVIFQLRNLLYKGFPFKQQDNSLAFAIIKMVQFNLIWACRQSEQVKYADSTLCQALLQISQDTKLDGENYLSSKVSSVDEFELVSEDSRQLLKEVLRNRQKYFQSIKYHSYINNPAYSSLHHLNLNVLRMFRRKIKQYLLKIKPNEKGELYQLCERIYLKIIYLYVGLQSYKTQNLIREMAYNQEHPSRLRTYIYLLNNADGLSQLINYFQQAPNSALVIDRKFLEALMNEQAPNNEII